MLLFRLLISAYWWVRLCVRAWPCLAYIPIFIRTLRSTFKHFRRFVIVDCRCAAMRDEKHTWVTWIYFCFWQNHLWFSMWCIHKYITIALKVPWNYVKASHFVDKKRKKLYQIHMPEQCVIHIYAWEAISFFGFLFKLFVEKLVFERFG